MVKFESEQQIARPADEVWAYAADIPRHPEWMGVADARIIDGRPTEAGARAVATMRLGPRRYQLEYVVARAEPGRRIAWSILGGGPLRGEVVLELDADATGGTRARYHGELHTTGAWRVLEPVLAGEIRSGEAMELRRLKTRLESTAGH